MLILEVLVFVAIGVLFLIFITQILVPLFRGTPFFPQFRKVTPLKTEVKNAEHALEETTEYVALKEKLNEINRRKADLEGK